MVILHQNVHRFAVRGELLEREKNRDRGKEREKKHDTKSVT